jgi:hypothetical protein
LWAGIGFRQVNEHTIDRGVVEPIRPGIGPGDELADLGAARRPRRGQAEQSARIAVVFMRLLDKDRSLDKALTIIGFLSVFGDRPDGIAVSDG